jgi:hypothetical protein
VPHCDNSPFLKNTHLFSQRSLAQANKGNQGAGNFYASQAIATMALPLWHYLYGTTYCITHGITHGITNDTTYGTTHE